MEAKNVDLKFSIAKKMFIFGFAVFVVILVTGIFKFNTVLNADKNFEIFKEKAVSGKFLVLEIEKELNNIDKLTRDIMLGSSYEENMAMIEKSKTLIIELFDKLILTVKGTLNESKKMEETKDSQAKTLAFLDDVTTKMKSLEKVNRSTEVLNSMYTKYIKETAVLAKDSKEAFAIIVKTKNNGLKIRTEAYHDEMSNLKNFILIESIIVLLLITTALFFLTRDIVGSLNKFKTGLSSFFDFLNRKK